MTGHGRGVATRNGLKVEVEISSVNRKQLDLFLNMPRPLTLLESRIQDDLARALSRGRVTVNVAVHGSAQRRRDTIRIDEDLAAIYVAKFRKAAKKLGIAGEISLRELIALPGVLHAESVEEDIETVWPVLQDALAKAIKGLVGMRQGEGAKLAKDLSARIAIMVRLLSEIRAAAPAVVDKYRKNLLTRIQAALSEAAVSEDRIEREIVIFADRSDITEETTRLDSHLSQAGKLLRAKDASGKSLDFLAQEMNREINTIGAKANDAAIAGRVVAFKTELERFREQVQNIE
jgi:uncharacterized protein (TIGR00255 family)